MDRGKVVVTGVGMVSPMGSDPQEIWANLQVQDPWLQTYDASRFAPFGYHPEKPFDAATQIEKKTLLRSMGRSQLYGVYAAGLALQSAGIAKDSQLLAETELLVACGLGDNDEEPEDAILRDGAGHANVDAFLNQSFMGLRPSLFLNQLPNLFAANISICHGVTGNSITFIGDETAGINVLNTAYRKIGCGQSDLILAGGIAEGGRRLFLESFAARQELLEGEFAEIWARTDDRICFGNGAGFLVLESEQFALERGARIKCYLADLQLSYAPRARGSPSYRTDQFLARMKGSLETTRHVIASSNAYRSALAEEERFWRERLFSYQNICNLCGGLREAAFPLGMALAVLCLERKQYLPPVSSRYRALRQAQDLDQVLVGCWGRQRGEAVALLEAQREVRS